MKTKNIVIIGASSGIGLELTKKELKKGNQIWAVARRRDPLLQLKKEGQFSNLHVLEADISIKEDVRRLAQEVSAFKVPIDVVVINAGIYKNDMTDNIDITQCEAMMQTNFYGALYCVNFFMPLVKKTGQFIAISSSSALKGSGHEGAGYAASKAALSAAFESFYLKWSKQGPMFTTIFYGPLDSTLRRTKGGSIFETSSEKAVQVIEKAIETRKPVFNQPVLLFFLLRLAKVMPSRLYLAFLALAESVMSQEIAKK